MVKILNNGQQPGTVRSVWEDVGVPAGFGLWEGLAGPREGQACPRRVGVLVEMGEQLFTNQCKNKLP